MRRCTEQHRISTHFTELLLFIINNSNANSALVGTSVREIVFVNVNKQFPKMPRCLKQPCSFLAALNGGTFPVSVPSGPYVLSPALSAWRI